MVYALFGFCVLITQDAKGESKANNAFSANNKKTTTSATTVEVYGDS